MLLSQDIEETVKEVFCLYENYGDLDYIGEPVSQIEHMSQAATFAQREGFDDEVILAAFFHDIGHLCTNTTSMGGAGNVNHEQLGANYLLQRGFSKRIAAFVEGHVLAKRYLTYKNPHYYQQLSAASKTTLKFQGGPMASDEATPFEQNPDFEILIKMRYWDDIAKETNIPINNLSYLKKLATNHLVARKF